MSGNSIGKLFRLTTFGESHGKVIGGIIDGCPAGLNIDLDKIQYQLDRRKPGQSDLASPRKESDNVEFLSGIFEGVTLGSPIGFLIKNKDTKPKDYSQIKDVYRPSHADYTWQAKYGIRDYRGGGRSSARETACRVVAGAIAQQILDTLEIRVSSYVSSVGNIAIPNDSSVDLNLIDKSPVRCPDKNVSDEMVMAIESVKQEGDSLGGVISGVVKNVPAGWGEPVFDKLHADLGKALFSINAVKGVSFGDGFSSSRKKGSEMNDLFIKGSEAVATKTNHSGGIQGGISNGSDIFFQVVFKPVASIFKDQKTIDQNGDSVILKGKVGMIHVLFHVLCQ